MKRYSIIYLTLFALAGLLYLMFTSLQTETVFFYGFAENKETEISHHQDILIKEIFVTNGQEVKKGDLLLIAQNSNLPAKINELTIEKKVNQADLMLKRQAIQDEISELSLQQNIKSAEIDATIREIQQKIEAQKSIYADIKSLDIKPSNEKTLSEIKIDNLQAKKATINQSYSQEIESRRRMLNSIQSPINAKNEILDSELSYFKSEEDRLAVYAPSDGLIGNVFCKEEENISSFSTLINFYKHNPTQVKGYVHESMILEVDVGDKLDVTSSLRNEQTVQGEVIGLGSRIVEIPERLRKIPEVKSYGREVLISIPAENSLLQKEKVMLNASIHSSRRGLGNLFSYGNSKKQEKETKKILQVD